MLSLVSAGFRAPIALAALLLAVLPAFAFDLQGHRGARGLAPENTIAAFEKALAIGVTTLELDVAITADGVAVVHHDLTLNPAVTRDEAGRWLPARGPLLRDLPLATLASYDVGRMDPSSSYAREFPEQQPHDGARIPTLAQLFARVQALGADDVRFNIEIKTQPTQASSTAAPQQFVDKIVEAVRAAGMERRALIQSFDWGALQRVRVTAPDLALSFLTVQNNRLNHPRDPAWTGGLLLRDFPGVPHMVKAAGGRVWAPTTTH